MTKTLKVLIFVMLVASVAKANIVCVGQTSTGELGRIEIAPDTVTVTGGFLSKPHIFTHLTETGGLITAPGLAITVHNAYGCMRHATIITEFREPFNAGYMETIHVGLCSGGSTPDRVCGIK